MLLTADGLANMPIAAAAGISPCGGGGVKAITCETPEDRGVPAVAVVSGGPGSAGPEEGMVEADATRPWRYRSWVFLRPGLRGPSGPGAGPYQRIWGRR